MPRGLLFAPKGRYVPGCWALNEPAAMAPTSPTLVTEYSSENLVRARTNGALDLTAIDVRGADLLDNLSYVGVRRRFSDRWGLDAVYKRIHIRSRLDVSYTGRAASASRSDRWNEPVIIRLLRDLAPILFTFHPSRNLSWTPANGKKPEAIRLGPRISRFGDYYFL